MVCWYKHLWNSLFGLNLDLTLIFEENKLIRCVYISAVIEQWIAYVGIHQPIVNTVWNVFHDNTWGTSKKWTMFTLLLFKIIFKLNPGTQCFNSKINSSKKFWRKRRLPGIPWLANFHIKVVIVWFSFICRNSELTIEKCLNLCRII